MFYVISVENKQLVIVAYTGTHQLYTSLASQLIDSADEASFKGWISQSTAGEMFVVRPLLVVIRIY